MLLLLFSRAIIVGTFYEFRIAAVNRVGVCSYSPITPAVRTEPDVPEEIDYKPEPVTCYPRAIILQWKEPHSWGIPIKTFEIEYRGGEARKFGSSPITTVTLSEAFSESEAVKRKLKTAAYDKIVAYNNRKKKQHAQVEKKKRRKMNSLHLENYLVKENKKYLLRSIQMSKKKNVEIDQRYSGLMSAIVRNLIPGNTYQFRVRAINNKGPGAWSPVGTSTATISLPPKGMPAVYTSHITPNGKYSKRRRSNQCSCNYR